jgi:hypothetical protein
MKLKKLIETTIREYLNEAKKFSEITEIHFDELNKIFNNKLGKLLGYGKYSFVFEYDTNKVIKIKNNNNNNYSDYGYYKTYKTGVIETNKDSITIDNSYLGIYNNKFFYIIMERLDTPKNLYEKIDEVEFVIKEFTKKEHPLLWLYNNSNDIDKLKELLNYSINEIYDYISQYNSLLETVTELATLFTDMKNKNIVWNDIHKGNFGYNKKGDITPFDMEF